MLGQQLRLQGSRQGIGGIVEARRRHLKIFDAVYSRALVYNTCWEDPAVDRRALNLGHDDTMLVITSAGWNVLDYALLGPRRIDAVDANPRQTALLELKLAGIRRLNHEDFFALFGHGCHGQFAALYRDLLRAELSPFARACWDARGDWFAKQGGGFYFHGLSGLVARTFRAYLRMRMRLAALIDTLCDSDSLAQQRDLYDEQIAPLMGGFWLNWTLSRQVTLSMLGVPHPQRREVIAQHRHGVAGFMRESIEYLARNLPFSDNYFYAVYVRGAYDPQCCPEYLKPAQFAALKAGLADRIVPHTSTVTTFLRNHYRPVACIPTPAFISPLWRRDMPCTADLRTLWHLARGNRAAASHAAHLEAFYRPQAAHYDRFRERLLAARAELIRALDIRAGQHVLELGAGTGRNAEFFAVLIPALDRLTLVDLCPALLEQARIRAARWPNCEVIEADATHVVTHGVDRILLSYALSMMPAWQAVLSRACAMLAPGGLLGVVDFYVSDASPPPTRVRHGALTRRFWPWWFAHDGVHLGSATLAHLHAHLETVHVVEGLTSVPYLAGVRVPYFQFVGQRR